MWKPIVIGILKQAEGKVLVGLRPSQAFMGNYWEFPGGKMELNETPEKALVRELREELGLTEVTLRSLVLAITAKGVVHREKESILLLFYKVEDWKGEPQPLYHQELRWVPLDELWNLKLLPANKMNLGRLCEIIEKE